MSRQMNLFATSDDSELIARSILEVFHNPIWIQERATIGTNLPVSITTPGDLSPDRIPRKVILLDNQSLLDVQTQMIDSNIAWVDIRNSPVVEYSPSSVDEDGTVRVGRFYCAYRGDDDLTKSVVRLFRVLKRLATRVPHTRNFWIFPDAKTRGRVLRYWAGVDEPNPFREGEENDVSN